MYGLGQALVSGLRGYTTARKEREEKERIKEKEDREFKLREDAAKRAEKESDQRYQITQDESRRAQERHDTQQQLYGHQVASGEIQQRNAALQESVGNIARAALGKNLAEANEHLKNVLPGTQMTGVSDDGKTYTLTTHREGMEAPMSFYLTKDQLDEIGRDPMKIKQLDIQNQRVEASVGRTDLQREKLISDTHQKEEDRKVRLQKIDNDYKLGEKRIEASVKKAGLSPAKESAVVQQIKYLTEAFMKNDGLAFEDANRKAIEAVKPTDLTPVQRQRLLVDIAKAATSATKGKADMFDEDKEEMQERINELDRFKKDLKRDTNKPTYGSATRNAKPKGYNKK